MVTSLRKNKSVNPILVIVHQKSSVPGRVGTMLQDMGFCLDIRRPRFGDALPETMSEHFGVVVFGGPMSANDDEDWLKREKAFFDIPLREKRPVLGICLGAQLLAQFLGGRVFLHEKEEVEIGYYPLTPTREGCAFAKQINADWPPYVYQWHRDGIDVPQSCTLLAKGEVFSQQAFCYGDTVFGLQFHPEVTYQMMCRWTISGHAQLEAKGAMAREIHLQDWYQYDSAVKHWLKTFLNHWAGL